MINLSQNPFISANISAWANGKNVLILRKADSRIKRFDGRRVCYELEHRWLSANATLNGDEVNCVSGNDFTYWSMRELRENGFSNGKNLFEVFNIF